MRSPASGGCARGSTMPNRACPNVVTLASLAELPRWVAWRGEMRAGKVTKVPYAPGSGRKARADDPTTWGLRRDAEALAQRIVNGHGGGVGIELGGLAGSTGHALGGIDFDCCRDPATGVIEPWAAELVARIGSYTEI